MKKSKVLAAALIGAVVSMGAGYAAWNDTLNITSTVSTGTLDVDFVTQSGAPIFQDSNALAGKDGATGTVVADENSATITLQNLYPGAIATITLPIKNNGTIPAKDGSFHFDGQPDWLKVSPNPADQASAINPGDTKNVVFTVTVDPDAGNAIQNLKGANAVTFKATATYDQFNN